MKTRIQFLLLAASLVVLPGILKAQPAAHYVPGVEGIKGASLPPPGWYVRDYNVGYYSSQINDQSGNRMALPFDYSFEAYVYANVPRVIWITDTKFLGGYVGVDALLPLIYTSAKMSSQVVNFNESTFGIGDFFAESTLSWHPKQFDLAVGAGVWAPTGDSGRMTSAGAGFWTVMLTAGGTWYMDQDKTWAVSALNRYEFNTEQRDYHYTPGDVYTLEWGVSKTLAKVIDVGMVGYYQQQVTSDSDGLASDRSRVAAVGPEISVAFPKPMLFVSFRYLNEFMAENRFQGHTFTLTFTKRF